MWTHFAFKYDGLNVTLSNLQSGKSESAVKNCTEITTNLSLNVIGNYNGKAYFSHKLLLNDSEVSKL